MTGFNAPDARPDGLWISGDMCAKVVAMANFTKQNTPRHPERAYNGGHLHIICQNGKYHVVLKKDGSANRMVSACTKLHAEVELYGLVEPLSACGCPVRECRKCKACR